MQGRAKQESVKHVVDILETKKNRTKVTSIMENAVEIVPRSKVISKFMSS